MDISREFGVMLRRERLRNKLTRPQLCIKINQLAERIVTSETTIQRMESSTTINIRTLKGMEMVLNVDLFNILKNYIILMPKKRKTACAPTQTVQG